MKTNQHKSNRQPNVIMIFPDTMTKNQVGAYKGISCTPNLDNIINNGMMFSHATPNSPVCSPARYNLLTGRYTSRSPVLEKLYTPNDPPFIRWNIYLKDHEQTLPRLLKQAGYTTGMVGKWHLGEADIQFFDNDTYSTHPGAMETVSANYSLCRDYIKKHSGFDYAESLFTNNEEAITMPKDIPCHHNMPWITQGALDFIEDNKSNPFFLYMSPNLPHQPDVLDVLESGSLLTPEGYLEDELTVQPSYTDVLERLELIGFPKDCQPGSEERKAKEYYAKMIWLDDGIGAVLAKLKALDLVDDTILIVNTDHLQRGKMTCYRQHLPLAFSWKGHIEAGSTCEALVSHVDLARTIADLCGVPDSGNISMDGKSFKPMLFNRQIPWDDRAYTEVAYSRGILTKDWNYVSTRFSDNMENQILAYGRNTLSQEGLDVTTVRYHASSDFPSYFEPDQLFHSIEDADEQINLANQSDYEPELTEMKGQLKAILDTFKFSYGEFTDENPVNTTHEVNDAHTDYVISRGQKSYIHQCSHCGHLQFGLNHDQCPVCHSDQSQFTRNDAVFYASEEKLAVGLVSHTPAITVNDPNTLSLDIGSPEDLNFVDIYRNDEFNQRIDRSFTRPFRQLIQLNEKDNKITVIANYRDRGYWQREITRGGKNESTVH